MNIKMILAGCISSVVLISVSNADNSTGYDIILLAGQSNMAGRGSVPSPIDTDGVPNADIKMWDPVDGIVEAKDPIIHPEAGVKSTKVGPGMTFAKSFLKRLRDTGYPYRKVLLVGAAWGGTSFIEDVSGGLHHRWVATNDPSVGGDLYRTAVDRANDAIAAAKAIDSTSAIKGILWMQGESDLQRGGASTYASKHLALMNALRNNITGASSVPVVVAEMAPCMWSQCDSSVQTVSEEDRTTMLNYIHSIQDNLSKSAWVSSAGLSGNGTGDNIHLNTSSQRELGRRFFSKFWEAAHSIMPPVVDLKIYNNKFFNVGKAIDYDSSYNSATTSARVNGNVTVDGVVDIVYDPDHGYVADILNSGGSLSLFTGSSLFNNSYTKMAWFKLRSNNYRNHLLSGSNADQNHFLYTSLPSKYLSAGHSISGSPTNIFAQQTSVPSLNTWRHVAVTYSSSAQTMTLYVNGVAVSTNTSVPASPSITGSAELTMSGYAGNMNYGLDGQMISNKAYDRVLTSSEISDIYNFEKLSQTGYGLK